MDLDIKLWGRATSVNVQKVAWVLAELGLTYDRVDAGGAFGRLDDPEYVSLNPNRRVPTLEDGGLVLWESNAICRYLVDAYGNSTSLKGETVVKRAKADMWMDWFQSTVYASFIDLFYQVVRLPPEKRDPSRKTKALDAVSDALALADTNLADQDFMSGARLGLGDIPIGACLYRYYTMDIHRASHPNLERYYNRLIARQAYRDHVMIDYSSLRGSD